MFEQLKAMNDAKSIKSIAPESLLMDSFTKELKNEIILNENKVAKIVLGNIESKNRIKREGNQQANGGSGSRKIR